MAASPASKAIDTQELTDKARRDLLQLLEGVRGKKNLVIERSLAGTVGLFVKFSTLQEYGVDKLFFLENHNVDSSQRNIVFLVRGENAKKARMVAVLIPKPIYTESLHALALGMFSLSCLEPLANAKIHPLPKIILSPVPDHTFIVGSKLIVAEQIKLIRTESKIDHDFTIIWTPRRTLVSNVVLEEHGVLGEANISELSLRFVPLEPDLLSLQLEDAFSDLCLHKDPTCVYTSAQALMLLQKQYGLFPRILGKGDNAKRLAELLERIRSEEDVTTTSDPNNTYLTSFGLTPSPLIENLIVIDREVDFATVLSHQLTYEGLIDENYGIHNNQTEVDSSIVGGAVGPQQQPNSATQAPTATTKRKIQLDSSDKLYPSIRDANFATIGPTLNRIARRLQEDQQNIHKQDQSVADLKTFVSKLPSYQAEQASLKIHTSLAEEIMKTTRSDLFGRILEVQQNLLAGSDPSTILETLEELLARDVPLSTLLRLLSLASSLNNGLRPRDLDSFRRQILQAYGHSHLLTLTALEKMSLLVPRESHRGYLNPIGSAAGQTATDWTAVRRNLALWTDEVHESDPEDPAYVFSGYAPLSVRLVQCVLQKAALYNLVNLKQSRAPPSPPRGGGWKGFEDTLARIPGAMVDVVQRGRDAEASQARKSLRGNKEGPKVSLVFFLGGVTYAEIAALRLVSRQLEEKEGKRLVIATTSLIGGKQVVGAAIEGRKFGE